MYLKSSTLVQCTTGLFNYKHDYVCQTVEMKVFRVQASYLTFAGVEATAKSSENATMVYPIVLQEMRKRSH